MFIMVLPEDLEYAYPTEEPHGTHFILVKCTSYSDMAAKLQPDDPKYPYSPEEPKGTFYDLVQFTWHNDISPRV